MQPLSHLLKWFISSCVSGRNHDFEIFSAFVLHKFAHLPMQTKYGNLVQYVGWHVAARSERLGCHECYDHPWHVFFWKIFPPWGSPPIL